MVLFLLSQFSLLISFSFSQFPQTAGISTTLIDYLKSTFGGIGRSVVDYLPKGGFCRHRLRDQLLPAASAHGSRPRHRA